MRSTRRSNWALRRGSARTPSGAASSVSTARLKAARASPGGPGRAPAGRGRTRRRPWRSARRRDRPASRQGERPGPARLGVSGSAAARGPPPEAQAALSTREPRRGMSRRDHVRRNRITAGAGGSTHRACTTLRVTSSFDEGSWWSSNARDGPVATPVERSERPGLPDEHALGLAGIPCGRGDDGPLADQDLASGADGEADVVLADELGDLGGRCCRRLRQRTSRSGLRRSGGRRRRGRRRARWWRRGRGRRDPAGGQELVDPSRQGAGGDRLRRRTGGRLRQATGRWRSPPGAAGGADGRRRRARGRIS